jgi:hypothetical protein
MSEDAGRLVSEEEARPIVPPIAPRPGRQALLAGADGYFRTDNQEGILNEAVALCLAGPAGEKLMNYLKSITLNAVCGPNVNTNQLLHLEGQRFIVHVLLKRQELHQEGRLR